MKVCLVNPTGVENTNASYPHGIIALHAALKDVGHEVEIFDCCLPDQDPSSDYLNSFDVVGISVMTTQLLHGMEIAKNLNKNVRVVWGGIHCLFDPLSLVIRFHDHYVIGGEGEAPMVKLLDYFEGKEDFEAIREHKGISFYHQDQPVINDPHFHKHLDKLPDINYYDLPQLERYVYDNQFFSTGSKKIPTLEIVTSRGCVWDCTFCINTIYKSHRAFHRGKSIEKIRREADPIIRDFDIEAVFPRDEDFFANTQLIDPWIDYAKEKGFFWGASARYNYFKPKFITQEKLKTMVDSGLIYLGMAIEAGEEDIRNRIIEKSLKNEEIFKTVEDVKASVGDGVLVNTSFIVDFPGDTHENKVETIKLMDFLSKNLNMILSGPQVYRAYPGTTLYDLEHHESGDVNYYLDNVNAEGETEVEMNWSSYFYAYALSYYYNWDTRFYSRPPGSPKHFKKPIIPKAGIGKFLFKCLLVTIALRIKFNYWKFFYEPPVIGWVWCMAKKCMETKFLGPIVQKIKFKYA